MKKLKKLILAAVIPALCAGSACALAGCGGHTHTYGDWEMVLPTTERAGSASKRCTASDCTSTDVYGGTLPVFDFKLSDMEGLKTDNGYTLTAVDATADLKVTTASYKLETGDTVSFPVYFLDGEDTIPSLGAGSTALCIMMGGDNGFPAGKYTVSSTSDKVGFEKTKGNIVASFEMDMTATDASFIMHGGDTDVAGFKVTVEHKAPGPEAAYDNKLALGVAQTITDYDVEAFVPKKYAVTIDLAGYYKFNSELGPECFVIGKQFTKGYEDMLELVALDSTVDEYVYSLPVGTYYVEVYGNGSFALEKTTEPAGEQHQHEYSDYVVTLPSVYEYGTGMVQRYCTVDGCPTDYVEVGELPVLDLTADEEDDEGTTENGYAFTRIATETGVKAFTVSMVVATDKGGAKPVSFDVFFITSATTSIAKLGGERQALCVLDSSFAGKYYKVQTTGTGITFNLNSDDDHAIIEFTVDEDVVTGGVFTLIAPETDVQNFTVTLTEYDPEEGGLPMPR